MNRPLVHIEPAARTAHDKRTRIIVTPEGVPLHFQIARAGSRVSALVIDLAIIIGSVICLTLFLVILPAWAYLGEFLIIVWFLGTFCLRMFYFTLFELRSRGATPGKRKTGIRVAARDGGQLRPDAVIARNLFREIELFLPLMFLLMMAVEETASTLMALTGIGWAGIMLMFPLTNRDRLRAGDLLAGTWVIEQPDREIGSHVTGIAERERVTRFQAADLDYYGERELHVLESVLREDRDEALEATATAIGRRLGREGEAAADQREFLQAYYEALRQHLESNLQLGVRKTSKHKADAALTAPGTTG